MSAKRRWEIHAQDYTTEEEFRDAVTRSLAECEPIGHRMGGGVVAACVRQPVQGLDGRTDYVTVGWVFNHTTVPVAQPTTEGEAPEVDEDEVAEPEPA